MNSTSRFLLAALAYAALTTIPPQALAIITNVAPGKPVSSSGAGFGFAETNGIDGNIGTFTHSHTNMGSVFWQLDLTAPTNLINVELVNRADGCCPERLNGAKLSILDGSMAPIFTSPAFAGAGVGQTFSFDNGGAGFSDARFIRVDHTNQWLSIGELRAFSDVLPPAFGNLANLFGTATQSTNGFGLSAATAIDGVRVGDSISHTDTGDMNPSLAVDLANPYRIERIDIYTRDNCCTPDFPERDYNLSVEVLDANGAVVYTHPVLNPWDGVDPAGGAPVLGLGALLSIDLTGLPGGGQIGQSVRINKTAQGGVNHSEWLSLAELEVYGSTTPVPEPTSLMLAAMGAAGVLCLARRRRL